MDWPENEIGLKLPLKLFQNDWNRIVAYHHVGTGTHRAHGWDEIDEKL
jgi:hypothetical protein